MVRHVDEELEDLKQMIVKMAGFVEKSIESIYLGIQAGEQSHFQAVREFERQVNQCHKEVDQTIIGAEAEVSESELCADIEIAAELFDRVDGLRDIEEIGFIIMAVEFEVPVRKIESLTA